MTVLLEEISYLPQDEPATKVAEIPAEVYNAGVSAILLWRRQNYPGWTLVESR